MEIVFLLEREEEEMEEYRAIHFKSVHGMPIKGEILCVYVCVSPWPSDSPVTCCCGSRPRASSCVGWKFPGTGLTA